MNPCNWPRWNFLDLGFRYTLWYLDVKTGEAVIQGSRSRDFHFVDVLRYPVTMETWL